MGHKWICRAAGTVGFLSVIQIALIPLGTARASDQVGTLTQVEGEVRLFSQPSKTLQSGVGTHARYQGEYYVVESAQTGDRVEQGNLVRTAPGAKARVVFDNGDQLNVGPATAMRVFWNKDAKDAQEAKTHLDLAYGKIRGIVQKGGPRSRLYIRTRTATMGVRGTDFAIADGGPDGGTELTIIRGEVEVVPRGNTAKTVRVKQGMSADVTFANEPKGGVAALAPTNSANAKPDGVKAIVELRRATQEDFRGIQRSSTVSTLAGAEGGGAKPASNAPGEKIAALEHKAVATELEDVRAYDPKLYDQIKADQSSKSASANEMNGRVLQALIPQAPRASASHKLHKSEIDNLDQGAYEKYFKQE